MSSSLSFETNSPSWPGAYPIDMFHDVDSFCWIYGRIKEITCSILGLTTIRAIEDDIDLAPRVVSQIRPSLNSKKSSKKKRGIKVAVLRNRVPSASRPRSLQRNDSKKVHRAANRRTGSNAIRTCNYPISAPTGTKGVKRKFSDGLNDLYDAKDVYVLSSKRPKNEASYTCGHLLRLPFELLLLTSGFLDDWDLRSLSATCKELSSLLFPEVMKRFNPQHPKVDELGKKYIRFPIRRDAHTHTDIATLPLLSRCAAFNNLKELSVGFSPDRLEAETEVKALTYLLEMNRLTVDWIYLVLRVDISEEVLARFMLAIRSIEVTYFCLSSTRPSVAGSTGLLPTSYSEDTDGLKGLSLSSLFDSRTLIAGSMAFIRSKSLTSINLDLYDADETLWKEVLANVPSSVKELELSGSISFATVFSFLASNDQISSIELHIPGKKPAVIRTRERRIVQGIFLPNLTDIAGPLDFIVDLLCNMVGGDSVITQIAIHPASRGPDFCRRKITTLLSKLASRESMRSLTFMFGNVTASGDFGFLDATRRRWDNYSYVKSLQIYLTGFDSSLAASFAQWIRSFSALCTLRIVCLSPMKVSETDLIVRCVSASCKDVSISVV